MTKLSKRDELKQRLIRAVREYGIANVLYRHAVGAQMGLNATDMECLGVLFFQNISTPTELARRTGLTSGATTAMLDRLEKSGLIERRPNPSDRRGSLIALAKSAAAKYGKLFEATRQAQDALISRYSDEQLALMADFFQRFSQIYERARGNPPAV
jgi:DNA-binding MarR family transcriptional regulator